MLLNSFRPIIRTISSNRYAQSSIPIKLLSNLSLKDEFNKEWYKKVDEEEAKAKSKSSEDHKYQEFLKNAFVFIGGGLATTYAFWTVIKPFFHDANATNFAKQKKHRNKDKADDGGLLTGLRSDSYVSIKLKSIIPYNHDSNIYQFELAGGDESEVFIEPGSFLLFRKLIDNEEVVRPYTPINAQHNRTLDFIIKTYPEGKMSKYVSTMKPGDSLEVMGPIVKKNGSENIYPTWGPGPYDIGMIAGGSGLTPMLQLIYERLGNGMSRHPTRRQDNNRLTLVYANKSYNDILLRDWLDQLAGTYSPEHQLRLVHVLEQLPQESGEVGKDLIAHQGHVNKELLTDVLPNPGSRTRIYVCGPPGMMKAVCGDKGPKGSQGELSGILKELGYTKEMVYKF